MSRRLPQLAGPSDLAAAALIAAGRPRQDRPDLGSSVVDVTTQADPAPVYLDRPAAALEVSDPVGCWPPVSGWDGTQNLDAAGMVREPVDVCHVCGETDGAHLSDCAGTLQAGDPCTCPPGSICQEDTCGHCRDLDPSLPCPHDTFGHSDEPDNDADSDDRQAAGEAAAAAIMDGPVTVDVGEPAPASSVMSHVDIVHAAVADSLRGLRETGPAFADLRVTVERAAPAPVSRPGAAHLPVLDWSSRHDIRSLAYGARRQLLTAGDPPPLVDVTLPAGPVLDQGAEGQCVGFAGVDAANVLRLAATMRGASPVLLGAGDAGQLYRRAQQLDDRPGESYTGTSVLAGMQAGVEAGLWPGYLWAFGTRDIADVLVQHRLPVVIGIPWLSGMYDTGPGGLVKVAGEDTGQGHCLVITRLAMRGPQRQPGPFFGWLNSWGADYGDGGIGWVHHADLAQLLAGSGEAAVPGAGGSVTS